MATKPLFDDHTYNVLKKGVMVTLPACATAYIAIAAIWGWPYSEQITATITALTTFLGLLLRIAANNYDNSDEKFDGVLEATELQDGRKAFQVILKTEEDAQKIFTKDVALLKVDSS